MKLNFYFLLRWIRRFKGIGFSRERTGGTCHCFWYKVICGLFIIFFFPFTLLGQTHWTPEVGKTFPDLQLVNQEGTKVQLSKYKGKVLLIEPIGMSCPACQALAGAHKKGSYKGIQPQVGLKSIEESINYFGKGASLSDDRLVFIQIIFFNTSMQAPSPQELKEWSDHFDMGRSSNFVVLGGTKALVNPSSRKVIPGFFLLDKDFILKYDSTGHNHKHNLFKELIPQINSVLNN